VGLTELLAGKGYLGGFFINASDWFFYAGDAKALNAFLADYAKLPDTPLVLVLHPGTGKASAPWDKEALNCDWSVGVSRERLARAPEAGEGKALQGKQRPRVEVTLSLWLGGQVGLSDLDVPLNVEVRSGGEIEDFVATHEAKRTSLKGKTN
jgi:hypothetical protein